MISTCLLALLATPSMGSPFTGDEWPYQEIANQFRADNGIEGVAADELELEPLLESHFFSARVGIFEVWIPNYALEKKEMCKDLKSICEGLVESQERWIDWLGEGAVNGETVQADLAVHLGWIKKWKATKLTGRDGTGAGTALEFFGADDGVKETSARLTESMQSGSVLGQAMESAAPIRIVLMPERKQFVEFLAFAGWWKPDLRSIYWTPTMQNWTEFRINDLQVIALQHPPIAETPGRYDGQSSMKATDESGLEQQVVQLATNQMLAYLHGESMPTQVLRSLSIQMLIEIYGSCRTRNDGDMRGRVTHARSVFIAGGQSEGGQLGKDVAENRWRIEYGKYHYRRILRAAQKAGKTADKRSKHKHRAFLIMSDSEKDRFIIRAPIFRPIPRSEPVPPGFGAEHAEFIRAYHVAFMQWLQTNAGGSKKASAALFARVMAQMAAGVEDLEFGAVLEDVYGIPMVNEKLDKDCIEGKFLKWIAKG